MITTIHHATARYNKARHGDAYYIAASPPFRSRACWLALRGNMFWKSREAFRLIPVLPKNYRSICLHAIEIASEPRVLMGNHEVTDFSEQGKLTQKGIRGCINLEILDGSIGILGFHDHPDEMWINESYQDFADYCEHQGWLQVQGPAS